jgi:tetratricopeptide (TPR) repeat protein
MPSLRWWTLLALALLSCVGPGCRQGVASVAVSQSETFAEMRGIKGDLTVTPPGETARAPYPRERITEGAVITVAAGGLTWIRGDGGAVFLVEGPARLVEHASSVELSAGRAFVDTNAGPPVELDTPHGRVELSDARASVEVQSDGAATAYVLRGSARTAAAAVRAGPGELLAIGKDGASSRTAAIAWDDWTGGLATADPAAEPAPFGVGTVGARPPGDKGKPRFSLVVQRLDVRVTVDHDLAITEVDETFVNPTSSVVEGIFSFRTPPGAVLQRFGVDRNGDLVWGRVKESAAAVAQYESNVYQGSTEDPALLQWSAPGTYAARLYPIREGAQRRVVTRYAEWLPRQGPHGDRRLYVYPMAAEGARGSLPRIEELTVTLDLSHAGATRVRAGMGGQSDGDHVIIKAFDVVPLADLAVELFDAGETEPVAYRAHHALTADDAPEQADPTFAAKVSREEPDYLLVPIRSSGATDPPAGVDLAVVVDTSAATEAGALAVSRSLASALLAHLGPADRAALWTGDATLHPVADGSGALTTLDAARRRAWLEGLSAAERGGATDIGGILTEAASKLDPARRGAVVYIGDGQPSVGEIAPKALRERLAHLPQGTRVFAAALGSNANVALLQSVARGAPVEPVNDAYGAARVALRLLEAAYRPTWVGATADLGPGVERVLPRELPAVAPDQGAFVVGRLSGQPPAEITLRGNGQTLTQPLRVVTLADSGDLRRRWGEQRLAELLEEGAGRAAIVDVARRFTLVSPFTSLYVPTTREMQTTEEVSVDDTRAARRGRWKPWWHETRPGMPGYVVDALTSDDKEGGTGTRAKGEEGSMGSPNNRQTNSRFGVAGPAKPPPPADEQKDRAMATAPAEARAKDLAEAQQFGIIGQLPGAGAGAGDPNAPSAPWGAMDEPTPRAAPQFGSSIGDTGGADARDPLNGAGAGGGGRGEGIGLGNIGTEGHGAPPMGGGRGRLGGAHTGGTPSLREGAIAVNGRLPPEVIQRIVRQNFGRFRLCYENGLRNNPLLRGRVTTKFVIDRTGAVGSAADGGSDMPDAGVVACVVRGFGNLSFPQPEGGNVTVRYPIQFEPTVSVASGTTPSVSPQPASPPPQLAAIGHAARPCGAAADLSVDERIVLWRERLSVAIGVSSSLGVYRQALADCEAPSWRERHTLLLEMVNRLTTVTDRVALWRALLPDPAAADIVYRSIVVRVQTPAELRELHTALGLRTVDPDLLAGILRRAKTPADRLSLLHATALKFPDDLELALRVLDAYEDAGDDAGGRAWARRLRHGSEATAHVYTNVGEYYLRLSRKQTGAGASSTGALRASELVGSATARDTDEARRTFGELVEFAPEDPVARRRLGDLLRAHGWYEEAFRQYETLAQLTPDDPAVPMLLAASAQGMGRIEEAVSWAEKAASAGSPDGSSAISRAARATATAFLAWARDDATRGGRTDEADRLRARARRLAGSDIAQPGSVRFLVTWSHPELHPALWTTALGAPMPATDSFPLFGVAQAVVPASPTPTAELRLDPDDAARAARLGAGAVVTAIVGEGTPEEHIARLDVGFGDAEHGATPQVKITLDGGVLKAVAE